MHDMRCENARATSCRCECHGTRHGATDDPMRRLDHRPSAQDTFCNWCGQPLHWDGGWKHPGGGMYMLECKRCQHHWAPPMRADVASNREAWHRYWSCPACGADHTQVADDHIAMPTHYSYRRQSTKRASRARKRAFDALFTPSASQTLLSAGGED